MGIGSHIHVEVVTEEVEFPVGGSAVPSQSEMIRIKIAFLISPYGLPKLAFWMLGKVQSLNF